jgi:hypothetical protein
MAEHTKDRLARELRSLGLDAMAERAATGYYDDYLSPHADNIGQLLADLMQACLPDLTSDKAAKILELRQRAINGEFDGTTEESEAWAASPEGQEVFRQLARSAKKPRPK